ncbi:CHAT domain-containing protein [Dyadobacter sp. Leaf189]|uniref:CHAT domain-containing protein n=1 Tax=Dyadobacter sp. Leaf189 TaxID=1736295 RepID=UPI000AA432B8|nr:CHAT domain-containing tetratricopeptide repeat protein [Dyadobacter sp. Leaf189]
MAEQTVGQVESYGRKACEIAIRQKHFQDAASYYLEIGKVLYNRGNYLPGIAQALTGLKVIDRFKIKNDTLKFKHFSLLAAFYSRLPMNDSATYWFTKSNDWLKQQPIVSKTIPAEVCGHYLNQALFHGWTGDFGRSTKYLHEALVLSKEAKSVRLESIVYNYLGNSYYKAENFIQADQYYRKALAGYKSGSLDNCWGEIILANNLRATGNASRAILQIQRAQRQYEQIVKKDPLQYDFDFEIQSANYLAQCFRLNHDLDAAEKAFKTCIDLHKKSGQKQGEFLAFSWVGLARIALDRQQADAALDYAREGINAARYPDGSKKTAFPAMASEKAHYEALLVSAEAKRGKWEKSQDLEALVATVLAYDESLNAAARLRRNMIPVESKQFHIEKVSKSTDTAVRLCYELFIKTKSERWKRLLFDLTERNRSMVISDLLHEKYRVVKEVPSAVITVERSLRHRTSDLKKQLAASQSKRPTDSLLALINKVDVQSFNFLDSLEREFKPYYELKYDFREMSLDSLTARLDRETAYLSFFLDKTHIYCILIHHGVSEVKRVLLPAGFSRLVMQLRQALVADPVMFAFSGQSQSAALYDMLVSPFMKSVKSTTRLIIARDGMLHYLPFEVLAPKNKTDQFLGRHFAISYSYSARLTFEGESQFNGAPKVLSYAPFAGDRTPDSSKLISSLSEVNAWKGKFFTDSSATKPSLYRNVSEADVLLLATHAMADVKVPENSFIAFHPDTPDSLLYATEIVNMPLEKLRLVVLSACEGHEGSFSKAEGLLSLARAFRIAGCKTILTTSWKAQSESISEFSKLFHQFLREGHPADIALLKTRQRFFEDTRLLKWAHPYYWANFTLIGNAAVIYPPETSYDPWFYGAGALLLAAFSVQAFRRSGVTRPL